MAAPLGLGVLGLYALVIEASRPAPGLIDRRPPVVRWLADGDLDRTRWLILWTTLGCAFAYVVGHQRQALLRSVAKLRAVPSVATYRAEPVYRPVLAGADDRGLRRRTKLAAAALGGSAVCLLGAHLSFASSALLSLLAFTCAAAFLRHREGQPWLLGAPLAASAVSAGSSLVGTPAIQLVALLGLLSALALRQSRAARLADPSGGYGQPRARRVRGERARAKRQIAFAAAAIGVFVIGARAGTTPSNAGRDVTPSGHAGSPDAPGGDVPALVDGGLLDARGGD